MHAMMGGVPSWRSPLLLLLTHFLRVAKLGGAPAPGGAADVAGGGPAAGSPHCAEGEVGC